MGENSDDEVDDLHQEAMTMYINYFEANAKHKVNVSQGIVDEISTSKLSYFLHVILYRGLFSTLFSLHAGLNENFFD